jgi:ribosome-binding factor A
MKSYRPLRVGELLQHQLAIILNQAGGWLGDYMFTVSEVRLSKDLKYADVWVSVMGAPEVRHLALDALKINSGKVRFRLSKAVTLRKLPELRFKLDESLDYAEKIERLLKESGVGLLTHDDEPTEPE